MTRTLSKVGKTQTSLELSLSMTGIGSGTVNKSILMELSISVPYLIELCPVTEHEGASLH